jgi:hypothetical protein
MRGGAADLIVGARRFAGTNSRQIPCRGLSAPVHIFAPSRGARMGFFVFAALLGAGLFLAIVFAKPPQNIIASRLSVPLSERFLSWSNASWFWFVLVLIGPLVIWLLLLFAIAGMIHWSSSEPERETTYVLTSNPYILRNTAGITDIVLSPAFTNVVLGLVFGAVLALWLYQLYRLNRKADDLDWKIKAEGIALALLFVFGSGVLGDRWIDRIEKFSFAGAELDLVPRATREGGAQSPHLLVPQAPPTGSVQTRAPFGLFQLAQLETAMIRDNLSLANGGDAADVTPDAAVSFVGRYVSPLARCHQAIYDTSGDRNFVKTQYAALLPPLRKFIRSLEFGAPTGEANALSDFGLVYAGVAGDTIARVYVDESTPLDSQLPARPWLAARKDEIKKMQSACLSLLEAGWTRSAAAQPVHVEAGRGAAIEGQGITSSEAKRFRKIIADSFDEDFVNKLKPGDARMHARPYLAIVLASVEAILEEPEAALKELDDWVRTAPDYDNLTAIDPHSFARRWYEARVHSAMYFISEEWIRRSFFVPTELREFSIKNLEQVVTEYIAFPLYVDGFAAYRTRQHSIATNFSELEPDSSKCLLPDNNDFAPNSAEYLRAYAGYVYILFLALELDKLLDARLDNDMAQEIYSNRSHLYLRELNEIDLSCFAKIDTDKSDYREQTAKIYADILRLNARMLQVDTIVERSLTDADQKKGSLKKALDAARLGLQLLAPFKKAEQDQPKQSVFQELGPSDLNETFDHLRSTYKDLKTQLNERDGS